MVRSRTRRRSRSRRRSHSRRRSRSRRRKGGRQLTDDERSNIKRQVGERQTEAYQEMLHKPKQSKEVTERMAELGDVMQKRRQRLAAATAPLKKAVVTASKKKTHCM